MKKLTKPYKVIYEGNYLLIDVTETPNNSILCTQDSTTCEEFDTYEEARQFINEHHLVFDLSKLTQK